MGVGRKNDQHDSSKKSVMEASARVLRWIELSVWPFETIPNHGTVERIPGGFKVYDANGQSLAYVYSRENPNAAEIAGVLTEDEARRMASNIARLPQLLRKDDQ